MIRPVNITPLNTTQEIEYICDQCNSHGSIHFTNRIINTDTIDDFKKAIGDKFKCPKCHFILKH